MRNLIALAVAAVMCAASAAFSQEKKTLEGTLVDSKCYIGSKGEFKGNDHMGMKGCGTMCVKSGIPAAIVDAKNNFYTLLAPAPEVANYIGETVRVTGSFDNRSRTVTADKLEVKRNGGWEEVKLKTMM